MHFATITDLDLICLHPNKKICTNWRQLPYLIDYSNCSKDHVLIIEKNTWFVKLPNSALIS